jgi:hypothetical protein
MHRPIQRLFSCVAFVSLASAPVWAQAQSKPVPPRQDIWAQQAGSFDQLRMLVKPGDTVLVNDLSGRSLRGRIVNLSSSSLRIDANGILHDFAQSDVREILQYRRDPLSNGATIGALIGAGFATAFVITFCRDDGCSTGVAVWVVGAYTGIGAGAGVGVDALIVREKTIFRPAMPGSARLRLEPLISRRTKGLAVVLSF